MQTPLRLALCLAMCSLPLSANAQIATDQTSYNVGASVQLRSASQGGGLASIRYAGEQERVQQGVQLKGNEYQPVWHIPADARTGRYVVDLTTKDGAVERDVASFAVHRQQAKVIAFELDKTFYTSGDAVTPHIIVQNISDHPLQHLQVEFENYTYPWIAQPAGEPPAWKAIAAASLTLGPGETKEFRLEKAAVVQAKPGSQAYVYYSAVIRDSEDPDHIYDLAFAPPAITAPETGKAAKTYPALYLYGNLASVPASEAYREFYPPAYVSDVIRFDRKHTMFPSHLPFALTFSVAAPHQSLPSTARLEFRVLDANGSIINRGQIRGPLAGSHEVKLPSLSAGLYTVDVAVLGLEASQAASARLDLAVNDLPRSILVFCAHEDDDTAHPEIIRAAVENNIPVHVVYFTGGDAGGCDRYYQHSCDASRAMDFGEVRMDEARASLGHLGVPGENVFFLGLPDGGMEQIWSHSSSKSPYLSVLLASEHAPYSDVAVPNLTYSRDAVLAATKAFLTKYKPDLVITGHPDEEHVDHRTNNWIVVEAMQQLLKAGSLSNKTQLIVDQVYGPGPQKHAPYHYAKTQFYVSGEAAKLGQEASWYYQTQDGNHQQAEIVTYDKLPRDASPRHFGYYHWPYPHYKILDWQEHEGWNEQ